MSKSLNLSKVLLASLAPIIAHQTTYAAQQVEPIQLNGAQIPQAANVVVNANSYAANDVAAQGFTTLISAHAQNVAAPLTSKVAASIAGWKADMGNNNLQVQWKQQVIQDIAAHHNNQNPKLQAVKQTFHAATLVSIQNDQQNGLVADQASLRANPNRAAAIYDTMKALAKALYDFREDQNEWGTLASLQHVFYLLEASSTININNAQVQVANIQQNNNAHLQALQNKISEDIDEFISSLHEWNPAAKVSFNDRANARQTLNLNVQDTNDSVQKFLDYKKQICGDFDGYITLDQFYQFNNTAAHMADLDGLDPKAFVNPNIMNELVFADGSLYLLHPGQVRVTANNEIDTMLRQMSLIDGTSTALKTQDIYRVVRTIDANFTLQKYNTAKAHAKNDSKAAVLNVNNTIAQNFANDLDKLKISIAKKLASETESSVKMATDFLNKDNGQNNNQTIFDDITALQIQNYDQINNIDELTDAIVQLFHNANPNNTIQQLKANDLKAIKISDTTFYKSTQPNNQNNNQIPDPVAEAHMMGIETFCNEMLAINNINYANLYTEADINSRADFIDALAGNYPDKFTPPVIAFLKDRYFADTALMANISNTKKKALYQLIQKYANPGEGIEALTTARFCEILNSIPEENVAPDLQQILHIVTKTTAQIVSDQNLFDDMMNNHGDEFANRVNGQYIKRDAQTILNDNQLRQYLVSRDDINNLQQQLNDINRQKQTLSNTINDLNNQITQLKEQIKQKENDLNRQLQDKDNRIRQINEHLVNNNNNIKVTEKDKVINNMEGALLNLPHVNRLQMLNFKNWIIKYEHAHGKIEDSSESDLQANCIWVLKNYAGKNALKDVLIYLKHKFNM